MKNKILGTIGRDNNWGTQSVQNDEDGHVEVASN